MDTWVFLRGLIRESQHWGSFVTQFAQTVPGSRVMALDLPGNGALHARISPLNVNAMVEDCRAQLARASVVPPYHLLAMSLGGMVAVAWASAYPDEVAAQVLINTSMRPFSAFHERLKPASYAALLGLALGRATPAQWERTIWRLTSNHDTESVLPAWIALRQQHPVSRMNALRQLVAASRFSAPATRPANPTLVLVSEQDRLVSAVCSLALAQHWQCDLRVHPTAGHDLALDDGSWIAAQVRDWLIRRSATLLTSGKPG